MLSDPFATRGACTRTCDPWMRKRRGGLAVPRRICRKTEARVGGTAYEARRACFRSYLGWRREHHHPAPFRVAMCSKQDPYPRYHPFPQTGAGFATCPAGAARLRAVEMAASVWVLVAVAPSVDPVVGLQALRLAFRHQAARAGHQAAAYLVRREQLLVAPAPCRVIADCRRS